MPTAVPWRLPHGAVLVERLVHDIPSADAPLVAAHHGVDVVAQSGEEGIPRERLARGILEHPLWRLAVPCKRVPDDEHAMPLAEGDVGIRGCEVVNAGLRMHPLPLEHVLRGDRVELPRQEGDARAIGFTELAPRQSRTHAEVRAERILQRGERRCQLDARMRRACGKDKQCDDAGFRGTVSETWLHHFTPENRRTSIASAIVTYPDSFG